MLRAAAVPPPFSMVLLGVALATAFACDRARQADWARVAKSHAPALEERMGEVLPDSQLKGFLPERLGDRVGLSPEGAITRMGDRAVSEASRSYRGSAAGLSGTAGEVQVQLKIADARLEPGAAQAVRSLAAEDDDVLAPERLILPSAIGYASYDEGQRVARAQVLIGGRFIASARVVEAAGPQEAAQALRALDTVAIARLAQGPQ